MTSRIIVIGKANTLSRQLRALQVMGCVPSGPTIPTSALTDPPPSPLDRKRPVIAALCSSPSRPLPVPHPSPIIATDADQPARERGIARQPERKPGNAVTVQQSRSEPLPVPHVNGSGTLERIVRWSNSEPAVLAECAVLIGCMLFCLVLAS